MTTASLAHAQQHFAAGRLDAAAGLCDAILSARPGDPDTALLRAMIFARQGQPREAIRVLEASCRAVPGAFAPHYNLAILIAQSGDTARALAVAERAAALNPRHGLALLLRGDLRRAAGDTVGARDSYRLAVSAQPELALAQHKLADLAADSGDHGEAAAAYERVVALEPTNAAALFNLGNARLAQGDPAAAAAAYQRALVVTPGNVAALINLGAALRAGGRPAEAEAVLRRALALDPAAPRAHLNLGNVLYDLRRGAEALRHLGRACALAPGSAEAAFALGNALVEAGDRAAGVASLRRAVDLKPDFAEARVQLVVAQIPYVAADEAEVAGSRAAFLDELAELTRWADAHPALPPERLVGIAFPYALAYQEHANRALLEGYGRFCVAAMGRRAARAQAAATPVHAASRSRLRVGVVSAHVRDHSVFNAITRGWLSALPRQRIELEVYHLGTQEDHQTAFAREHADYFAAGARGLGEWVGTIEARRPDVLVYPEIGMDAGIVRLASLRLAPVQAVSWGHPETTGLPTMDYFLSAAAFEPAEGDEYYAERLVRLAGLGCYYESTAPEVVPCDLEALGIDPRRPVLLCAGTVWKYTPAYDGILVALAAALPSAQLVFFTDPRRASLHERLTARLAARLSERGLSPERQLRHVPWCPAGQFYGLMKASTALLDTVGFSGFNTVVQAIECDLPVVTLQGRYLRGRLGSGTLDALGAGDHVSADAGAYVARAVELATDPVARARAVERLRAGRPLLYRDTGPLQELADFLEAAVDRAVAR